MSKYVFVKASVCYADEFDCNMFGIFSKAKWDDIVHQTEIRLDLLEAKHNAKEKDGYDMGLEIELYFGTNESLIISNFDNWYNEFTIKPITEKLATEICSMFDRKLSDQFTYGTGSGYFTGILELYDETGVEL